MLQLAFIVVKADTIDVDVVVHGLSNLDLKRMRDLVQSKCPLGMLNHSCVRSVPLVLLKILRIVPKIDKYIVYRRQQHTDLSQILKIVKSQFANL